MRLILMFFIPSLLFGYKGEKYITMSGGEIMYSEYDMGSSEGIYFIGARAKNDIYKFIDWNIDVDVSAYNKRFNFLCFPSVSLNKQVLNSNIYIGTGYGIQLTNPHQGDGIKPDISVPVQIYMGIRLFKRVFSEWQGFLIGNPSWAIKLGLKL